MPCEFVQYILDLFATTSTSTIATTTLTLASSPSSQPPQNPSFSLSDAFTTSAAVPETDVDVRLLPNIDGSAYTSAGMPDALSQCSLFANSSKSGYN